ncbi:MAG: YafY family transcriptional regulator [Clostridiales bacterium]|nr:YafY family transcriptional regulator [Clostridiales bacterium]
MKIDRLIGILAVLQNKKKTSAPYLAERFEVSRRTISRDIEDLCKAGIPIVTTQGVSGGISLMEGFQLDRTIFTAPELQSILIGLKSLDSVFDTSYTKLVAEKLALDEDSVILPSESFIIDLSAFHKNSLTPKIKTIRKAIQERRRVQFHYYYDKGEADRKIEPYLIIYKWSAWYLFGFCMERNDFRMFKLDRLWELKLTDEIYDKKQLIESRLSFDGFFCDEIEVTVVYEESEKYKLVETFGPESFTVLEDGRLLMKSRYRNMDTAVKEILGFAERAEVLGPEEVRTELLYRINAIKSKYQT